MTRVLHWNGRDLPDELRELPPGWYVVEDLASVEPLDAKEEEGIRDALRAFDEGRGRPAAEVHARLRALLDR